MTFYNVPDFPGVPPMLRDPSALVPPRYQPAASLILDFAAPAAFGTNSDATNSNDVSPWGIFDPETGQAVIRPDSFLGLEYRNSTRISNYPLEKGSFESYNKVNDPYDVVVGMACGGDQTTVADFLATAKTIARSLDLYTVATPDEIFESANIERYDYKRTQRNGAWLVTVNFYLKEIRINQNTEFTHSPENGPTTEEAQAATTPEVLDTARASPVLTEGQSQNPASVTQVSQGQTNALPATPEQSAPSPGSGAPGQSLPTAYVENPNVPKAPATSESRALVQLPPGYTQSSQTGLIRDPFGRVDREMTVKAGSLQYNPANPDYVEPK